MIDIIIWVVELVIGDIAFEVSVLSQYLLQPRTGQLFQSLHLFKYLGIHKDSDLAFNPEISKFSDPLTINSKIKQIKNMYTDAVEYFPPNAPPPRGKSIQVSCFVDRW